LFNLFKKDFGDLSDKFWPIIKKIFANFRHTCTFEEYYKIVHNLVSIDQKGMFKMLFNVLDINQDKIICEKDLFDSMALTKSKYGQNLISDDLAILSKFMNQEREN
jgi:Ca2+-binding EF-hand superfamily protein